MIRRAKPEDVPALLRLLLQVGNLHAEGRPDIFVKDSVKYDKEALIELMRDEDRPILVHVNDKDETDGYCFCEIQVQKADGHMQPRKSLYIDDLCVNAATRGSGVGKELYHHVCEYAKSIGCDAITLNVWECNPTARRFYEKMGLRPMKTTMEFHL